MRKNLPLIQETLEVCASETFCGGTECTFFPDTANGSGFVSTLTGDLSKEHEPSKNKRANCGNGSHKALLVVKVVVKLGSFAGYLKAGGSKRDRSTSSFNIKPRVDGLPFNVVITLSPIRQTKRRLRSTGGTWMRHDCKQKGGITIDTVTTTRENASG